MKRHLLVIGLFLGLSIASYGSYVLLQPCRLLDRLIGLSGCERFVKVADFDPLNGAALSPQDASGQVSLFGHALTEEGWVPSVVRLDLERDIELSRFPVDAGPSFGHLIFSADGEKAVLTCMDSADCTADGHRMAIVSAKDGKILETGHGSDTDYIVFPGEVLPNVGEAWVQLFAGNGMRVVDIRRDGSIVLLDPTGNPIATLFDGPRNDVLRSGISVSPSGQYIAMFDRSHAGTDARLFVWDALSGERLSSKSLGTDYIARFTPVWISEEALLTLLRRNGPVTYLELYRWQ